MLPSRVLVTGSSGHLGAALVRRLRAEGVVAVGLDPVPGPCTDLEGSVVDQALTRRALRENRVQAVVHAGALHKPQVATHSRHAFIDVNVRGTQNLLEAATDPGAVVDRFVFTSTTSLMIDRALRAGGAPEAAWIDEGRAPLAPRNIYGVSKLAAEHLCRLHHELTGLPVITLRTSRFFPEEDDQAARISQAGLNTKINELLFRRATLADMVEGHLQALRRAPSIGHGVFILSGPSPFRPEDCAALGRDAPAVVARYFPRQPALYAERGWSFFDRIDRVYHPGLAERALGWRARRDFAAALDAMAAGEDMAAFVGHDPSYRVAPEVAPEV